MLELLRRLRARLDAGRETGTRPAPGLETDALRWMVSVVRTECDGEIADQLAPPGPAAGTPTTRPVERDAPSTSRADAAHPEPTPIDGKAVR